MRDKILYFAVLYLSGLITVILIHTPPLLTGQTPTRVDASTQIKNPPAAAIIQQTTQVPTIFEDTKRVTVPTGDQPCALGTWALDQTHFYLCLEPSTNDHRWIRMNVSRPTQ